VCRYTTLLCDLKVTTENKISVTTHFKKLTIGNNVFNVIFSGNRCILQFLHQMFNVSTLLLLDDALLKCAVTEFVLFSVVAFKTLPFHKVV